MTEPPTPDLTAKVIGYRKWTVDRERRLLPMNRQWGEWKPGVNVAYCAYGYNHLAPDSKCGCGLYAVNDIEDIPGYHSALLIGAVAGWGKVQIHADGWRAQKAQVVAFGYILTRGESIYRTARQVARRFGVQLVSIEELEEVALEYGQPVPESLTCELGIKRKEQREIARKHMAFQKAADAYMNEITKLFEAQGYTPTVAAALARRWRAEAEWNGQSAAAWMRFELGR